MSRVLPVPNGVLLAGAHGRPGRRDGIRRWGQHDSSGRELCGRSAANVARKNNSKIEHQDASR